MGTKIGLKLWNINEGYIEETVKLFKDNAFDFIELYIVPGKLDKIGLWKNLDIPINIHAPHFKHGMNLSKKESLEGNLEIYNEVKLYADSFNSDYIVFHGGTDGDYLETSRQLLIINDTRSVIENKPYKTLPEIAGNYYVGGKIDEIKYVIDITGCRFCLDIGHAVSAANALGFNPYLYIQEFMLLNPYMFHLSDIDIGSEMDAHLNYGNGNLDFKRIVDIIGKDIMVAIETQKKDPIRLDDFKKDTVFLKNIMEE